MTSDEIVKKILRFKPYFKNSGGGVTFSGGDPLFQDEFLLDMFKTMQTGMEYTLPLTLLVMDMVIMMKY